MSIGPTDTTFRNKPPYGGLSRTLPAGRLVYYLAQNYRSGGGLSVKRRGDEFSQAADMAANGDRSSLFVLLDFVAGRA